MKPPASSTDKGKSSHDAPIPPAAAARQGRPTPISGIIGRGSAPVSDSEREAAEVLSKLVFGDDATRSRKRPPETPREEEDSNIALRGAAGDPATLDDLLGPALAAVDYSRIEKLVYRANWSTAEVEHILSFDTYGRPKEFLTGNVGVRNSDAEAFAEQCQRRYASPIIRNSEYVLPSWWCSMHCGLGMLAGWKSADTYVPNYKPAELARKVVQAIEDFVLPYVGGVVKTPDDLYRFLSADSEPMRWFRVGGYFRAAQVAFLGCKLGIPLPEIEATLNRHRFDMKNGLDEKEMTPDQYIAHILRDAEAATGDAG